MLTFCPYCANCLYPSRTDPSDDHPDGQNCFACRTCPYRFLLERTYFERKEMKRKEVEDVMGGKAAWANVDKTDGKSLARCITVGGSGDQVGACADVWDL